jgi:hypothetical protein
MGIIVNTMKILDGVVSLNDVYGHIREIEVNKGEDDGYTIRFISKYYVNVDENTKKNINTEFIQEKLNIDDFSKPIWEVAYTILKEKLTSKGLSLSDDI